MSTLYISEFSRQTTDSSLQIAPIASVSGGVLSSQVTFTNAASVQSVSLADSTTILRIVSDANCFVSFGVSPTAVSPTSMFLLADVPEYFGVDVSEGILFKVAVRGA